MIIIYRLQKPLTFRWEQIDYLLHEIGRVSGPMLFCTTVNENIAVQHIF